MNAWVLLASTLGLSCSFAPQPSWQLRGTCASPHSVGPPQRGLIALPAAGDGSAIADITTEAVLLEQARIAKMTNVPLAVHYMSATGPAAAADLASFEALAAQFTELMCLRHMKEYTDGEAMLAQRLVTVLPSCELVQNGVRVELFEGPDCVAQMEDALVAIGCKPSVGGGEDGDPDTWSDEGDDFSMRGYKANRGIFDADGKPAKGFKGASLKTKRAWAEKTPRTTASYFPSADFDKAAESFEKQFNEQRGLGEQQGGEEEGGGNGVDGYDSPYRRASQRKKKAEPFGDTVKKALQKLGDEMQQNLEPTNGEGGLFGGGGPISVPKSLRKEAEKPRSVAQTAAGERMANRLLRNKLAKKRKLQEQAIAEEEARQQQVFMAAAEAREAEARESAPRSMTRGEADMLRAQREEELEAVAAAAGGGAVPTFEDAMSLFPELLEDDSEDSGEGGGAE